MVPPDSFSTAAPQSSSDFCSGCDAGTQCDSFNSKVFSCANAGVTLAASSNANNVFLITIVSPDVIRGDDGDEEDVIGVAAGRQCDACVGAGKDLRIKAVALGTGVASAAKVAGGLGRRGRKRIRRYHQR